MSEAGAGRGPRLPVILHGLWMGWTGVLLLAHSRLASFKPFPPPDGIINACFLAGFPKQQDYFWFAAMLAGGWLGVAAGILLERRLGSRRGWGGWLPKAGAGAGIASLAGALSLLPFGIPVLLAMFVAGCAAPWLGRPLPAAAPGRRGGIREAGGGKAVWLAVLLALAAAWSLDTCRDLRPIDGLHEGRHLLLVQERLAGNSSSASEYGPLYTWTLYGWMRAFGMTVSQERQYFMCAQFAGIAVFMLLLWMAGTGRLSLAVSALLILAFATPPDMQYGWANPLRLAVPLAGLWMLRRALGRGGVFGAGAAGMVAGLGVLYSPENGMAAVAAGLLLVFLEGKLRPAAAWAAFLGVTILSGALPMGAGPLPSGGYIWKRLMGAGVLPFPPYPWWPAGTSPEWNMQIFASLAWVWGPGLLACGVLAWIFSRRARGAEDRFWAVLAVFSLLASFPALSRPFGQELASAPAGIMVLAFGLSRMESSSGLPRRLFVVLASLLLIAVFVRFVHIWPAMSQQYACAWRGSHTHGTPGIPRLGGVVPEGITGADLREAVRLIREHCPPDRKVYLGSIWHAHLPFLAERRVLGPVRFPGLRVTARDRERMVEAMERERPAVALVAERGMDAPFSAEHPEEHGYLARNYLLHVRTGGLLIYLRR